MITDTPDPAQLIREDELLQVGTSNEEIRGQLVSPACRWQAENPPEKMMNKKRTGRRAQDQREQKAKLDSASETTSQYDAIQLNQKGSCTEDGSRGSTTMLNMCTYNFRTLRTEDNLERRIHEADQIKWDIVGLCETY